MSTIEAFYREIERVAEADQTGSQKQGSDQIPDQTPDQALDQIPDQTPDQTPDHQAPSNKDLQGTTANVMAIRDAIEAAATRVRAEDGVDLMGYEARQLPGDIAGQYETGAKLISLDTRKVLGSGDEDLIVHVAKHEHKHKINHRKNEAGTESTEAVSRTKLDEDITESATQEETGLRVGYQELNEVNPLAAATGITRAKIFALHEEGRNASINALDELASGQEEKVLARIAAGQNLDTSVTEALDKRLAA